MCSLLTRETVCVSGLLSPAGREHSIAHLGFIEKTVYLPLNPLASHAKASGSEGVLQEIAALYAGLMRVASCGPWVSSRLMLE